MDSFTIKLKNMTEGFKAKNVLNRAGIRAVIQRYHGKNGCSFKLVIYARQGEACALLGKAGISCDIS